MLRCHLHHFSSRSNTKITKIYETCSPNTEIPSLECSCYTVNDFRIFSRFLKIINSVYLAIDLYECH